MIYPAKTPGENRMTYDYGFCCRSYSTGKSFPVSNNSCAVITRISDTGSHQCIILGCDIWYDRAVLPMSTSPGTNIISGIYLCPLNNLWIHNRASALCLFLISCRIETKSDKQKRLKNSFISQNRAHDRSLPPCVYIQFKEDNLLPGPAHQGTFL